MEDKNGSNQNQPQEPVAELDQLYATSEHKYTSPAPTQALEEAAPSAGLHNKRGLALIVGLVALFLLFLIGAGVAAYLVSQNNKPEKVLADALINTASDLLENKPTTLIGGLSIESKRDNPFKIGLTLNGLSSGENGKGSADINIVFAGKSYTMKGSAVVFGSEEYYIKIENLEKSLSTLAATQSGLANYVTTFEPVINKIDNQWIKISSEDLRQFGISDETSLDRCANAVKELSLATSDKKRLNKLFRENQFIVADETLDNEVASEENSFHYKIDFNDAAAQSFAKQTIAMESFEQLRKNCEIDDKKIKDKFSENLNSEKTEQKLIVELWVGKKSRRFTKLRVVTNNKDVTVDLGAEVKFDTEYASIEKPLTSTSVKELQLEFEKITSQQAGGGILLN